MRMEQLQEKLSTLAGFLEEKILGLEKEKEQHLEDIIARIAPGENDPGYKAPCIEDIRDRTEVSWELKVLGSMASNPQRHILVLRLR